MHLQIAKRFLNAVKESKDPKRQMAFFISCNPEDVLRQAEESTKRYERGSHIYDFFYLMISFRMSWSQV